MLFVEMSMWSLLCGENNKRAKDKDRRTQILTSEIRMKHDVHDVCSLRFQGIDIVQPLFVFILYQSLYIAYVRGKGGHIMHRFCCLEIHAEEGLMPKRVCVCLLCLCCFYATKYLEWTLECWLSIPLLTH